jgi:hypothetical protein
MRLGCLGCLFLIIVLVAILVAVAGAIFLSFNVFDAPDMRPIVSSRGDGYSAQRKLYEVALRQSGLSSRKDPIVLTEREANAFLTNHLAEVAGLSFSGLSVQFIEGQVVIHGQTPLRNLLQGPPFAQLLSFLPESRLDQPVWVTVRGAIELEPRPPRAGLRHGRLVVADFALGKQPVAAFLLYVMMGPAGGALLRWQVPAVVEAIDLESRQLVIRTR